MSESREPERAEETTPMLHEVITKHNDPCRDGAADDEPLFTLRAQDEFAPGVVRTWAAMLNQRALIMTGEVREVTRRKADSAMIHAQQMEDWQKANPNKVKVPD